MTIGDAKLQRALKDLHANKGDIYAWEKVYRLAKRRDLVIRARSAKGLPGRFYVTGVKPSNKDIWINYDSDNRNAALRFDNLVSNGISEIGLESIPPSLYSAMDEGLSKTIHNILLGVPARGLIEADKERTCKNCEGPISQSRGWAARYCGEDCRSGHNKERKSNYSKEYEKNNIEKRRGINKKSGKKRYKNRAGKILGRVCRSCGLTDVKTRFKTSGNWCGRCEHKRRVYGKCITAIHAVPPSRALVFKDSGNPARDYPACLCTTGTIKPDYTDPNNKYPPRIPLEDKNIPEFNYIASLHRRKDWLEMTTAGEGILRGKKATSKERKKQGGKWVPGISGGSRKGSSDQSPRRSTRGGSPFDIGPRRPRNA